MQESHLRIILFFVGLLCPSSESLAIRKRSINSDELISDGQLLHAIDVIERAKLQRSPSEIYNEELLDETPTDNDVVNDLIQTSYEQQGGEDDLDLNSDKPDIDTEIDDNEEENLNMNFPPKNEKRVVDRDELESIFKQQPVASQSETKMKDLKTEGMQLIPAAEKEKMFQEVATLIGKASEEAQSTLAPAVVEIEKIVRTETKPEPGKTIIKTETTDWELKPNNEPDTDTDEDDDILSSQAAAAANKEWLLNLVEQKGFDAGAGWKNKKAKRSEQSTAKDEQRELIKNTAVELLKAYMEEQEEEKRHLSRALNLATMAQVERTDRYVPNEINEIKQAVKDEQLIEALRNVMTNNEMNGGNGLDNEELDEKDDDDKRSGYFESSLTYRPEESPSLSNEEDEEEEERLVGDLVKDRLRDRLREYVLQRSQQQEEIAEDEEEQEQDASLSTRPEDTDRFRLNPFLREVESVENLKTAEKRPFDDTSDECLEIEELIDNCATARQRGLLLDEEATDLCNRHQLCYECGSYYGMTADSCDRGYMGAAHIACSRTPLEEDKCHAQALELYSIMFNSHEFTGDMSSYQCTAPCVYDFIVNSERG